MSDKKPEKDYRKVDQPSAESIFSEPNNLSEALKDLEDYENWSNTDNLFQSTDADRLVVEKHDPFEDADKAKKVKKEAADVKHQTETKNVSGIESELEEIMKILKDSNAYEEYLGITDAEVGKPKVNTKEFPMDDKKGK
jgi:cell fate (sporulation/competence/biofilm development) regulator YlbF (YheA/YmcA/DUF963 family)